MEQEILQNTYNKKFHNALNKEEQKVPPIWLMRQAGRYHKHYRTLKEKYSFEQLCKEPELACEVTLGPIAEFDFDAAILFSDILFPLDYLGMGLKFKPGPIFERNLNSKMISEFNIDEFESFMEFQNKSLNLIRNELPNDKSLIGFTGGPFTLYHFAIRNNPVSEKLFQQTLHQVYPFLPEKQPIKGQELQFNLKIYKKLLDALYPEFSISKNITLKGKIASDLKNSNVTVNCNNSVDLNEHNIDNLYVYPNPSKGNIFINYSKEIISASIYNIVGKK